jgi:hypothetical protein
MAAHDWYHRLVISPYLRLLFVTPILVAALLAACKTPAGNYRNDDAHKQLLQTLRECLVEVPSRGDKDKGFVSPCIRMDVSPLNGISRSRLIDALGPARFCTSSTDTSFPEKDDCPLDQNPQWSFYRLADAIVSGGGPELICFANKTRSCVTVEFRRSQ